MKYKEKRIRTNLTLHPRLLRKCQALNINISGAVDRILLDKLKKVSDYRYRLEAHKKLNTCTFCNVKKGYKDLTLIEDCYPDKLDKVFCDKCLDCKQDHVTKTNRQRFADEEKVFVKAADFIDSKVEWEIKRKIY